MLLDTFSFVQIFFQLLNNKQPRDLRPTHLGEEALKVHFHDLLGLLSETLDKWHKIAAALLKTLPIGDKLPGLGGKSLGRDTVKLRVESLEKACDIGLSSKNLFQGLIICAIQRSLFDSELFDILVGFHEIKLGAGELSLLGELVAEFEVAFLIGEKAKIIRIEFFGSAFYEDGFETVFLVHVAQELFDLHLGLIVCVSVLDMKNELRIGG